MVTFHVSSNTSLLIALYIQNPNNNLQPLIRTGFNNLNFSQPNPQTNPLITAHNYSPNQGHQQQYLQNYPAEQQFYLPNNQGYHDGGLLDYQNHPDVFGDDFQQQQKQQQQGIRQPTTLINNQPSLLFAAMAGPLTRFSPNPCGASGMNFSPSSSSAIGLNRMNVRPHYDHLKLINVHYNPYQSKFNPTLMAKPSLDGYQSSQISSPITAAIATRRDPKYSSVSFFVCFFFGDKLS